MGLMKERGAFLRDAENEINEMLEAWRKARLRCGVLGVAAEALGEARFQGARGARTTPRGLHTSTRI